MPRFRSMPSLQKFAAVQASVHNHFNLERHLYSRPDFENTRATALDDKRQIAARTKPKLWNSRSARFCRSASC
jgi:putative transposase